MPWFFWGGGWRGGRGGGGLFVDCESLSSWLISGKGRQREVLDVRMQFEGWRTPLFYTGPWRIPSPFLLSSSLTFISSSVRFTMLGINVSLTGETKIMFMGSSSTGIIFHISATAWALWGSKSDFLLSVPMGNIMGKRTDWIVIGMAWRSCGRVLLCLGVLCACVLTWDIKWEEVEKI